MTIAEARQPEERIGEIEKRLMALSKTVPLVEQLEETPWIGLLSSWPGARAGST